MNTITKTSPELLHELFDWCQTARNLYTSASQRHDSPGLRALKTYLAERHAAHLRDLRQTLHELGGTGLAPQPHQPYLPGLGQDVQQALSSPNRGTAMATCGLVERQVALAYDRVWQDPMLIDEPARNVVSRHLTDLESSQEFVRQIEAEQNRLPHVSRTSFAST